MDIPNWRKDSVMLMDNASWHKTDTVIQTMKDLEVPLIFSAQYSYSAAPIELMFSSLKKGTLLPFREQTGKK